MVSNRLQDDLLQEFREEKKLIGGQIELFEPLAASLRKPAARRLAGKGLILFGEILCWCGILGCIALAVFLNKLYPFYLLAKLGTPAYSGTLGANNVLMLQWSFYGLIVLSALLLLLLSRGLRRIRQKNDVLHMAGTHIRTLVGQHLQRKAAINAIEQRHLTELPQAEPALTDATELLNPGYDRAE